MRAIPPEPSSEQRIALVTAVVLTFLGSLTWNLERPVGGRVLQVLTLVAMTAGLYYLQFIPPAAEGLAPDGSWQYLRPVRIPWQARFANDLTSAGLLGFAMTAMLVGHSYLISPGLSIRPLIGQIVGLGIVLLARADVAAWALWIWAGEHDITSLNDINLVWPVRWLVGLVGPLIFGWMAYRTAKIRSTQSATGILFVVVILTFLGELFGLLLSRITGLPL